MIPRPPEALQMLSQRILSHLVPDLQSSYGQSEGGYVGMLLLSLVKELESGIERRLADIRDMKVIFEQASSALPPSMLPDGLDTVDSAEPASLSMSDVNALHDQLASLLIALHDAVDVVSPNEAQQKVNATIWRYLGEHARRHRVSP